MKNYKVKYALELGAFTKEQLIRENVGGCDQILICSYLEGDDGSGSYLWVSSNGAKGEMADYRKFHCMVALAKQLSESKTLNPSQAAFCRRIFEAMRTAVQRSKET